MDIIDKLKKGKKDRSVFDSLIKKKEAEKEFEETPETRPPEIVVRELKATEPQTPQTEPADTEPKEDKPVREFRTEGMREFDFDSLGTSSGANVKIEYKAMIAKLIDENKIDDAIGLLQELKTRLSEQK